MANPPNADTYDLWGQDASVLHEIGKYLRQEQHPIRVHLPRTLAELALAAWRRDDSTDHLEDETHDEYRVRSAAATLALIGLSLESGFEENGDEVIFELDAWHLGLALEAGDDDRAP